MRGTIPSFLIRAGQQKKGRHPAAPENEVKAVTFRHPGDVSGKEHGFKMMLNCP